jgi:DnaJ-class molecular chaperone
VPVLCPACQGDLHKSFHRCKKCRGVGFIDAKCKTCNGTGEFIEKMEEEKE